LFACCFKAEAYAVGTFCQFHPPTHTVMVVTETVLWAVLRQSA